MTSSPWFTGSSGKTTTRRVQLRTPDHDLPPEEKKNLGTGLTVRFLISSQAELGLDLFVNKGLVQYMDRLAVLLAYPDWKYPKATREELEQAHRWLDEFNLEALTKPKGPAHPSFHSSHHFTFSTHRPSPWEENNRVHGRWYASETHPSTDKGVVLLHGWNGEYQYRFLFDGMARRLNAHGIHVGMVELPYHGHRKPRSSGACRNFISQNLFRMADAALQSISDVRQMLLWMERQGCHHTAVWGISLGGWVAGLVACAESQLQAVVLQTPLSNLEQAIQDLAFCGPIRTGLAEANLPLSRLSLHHLKPLVPVERQLIVTALHDLIVPPATLEQLWRAWKNPEMWRVRHGHISILISIPFFKNVRRWLEQQLASTQAKVACPDGSLSSP